MSPLARRAAVALLPLLLTACRSSSDAPPARPPGAIHDHTPRHGGVVAMVGMIHLEALAAADGRVRVYLTDLYRQPLPLEPVQGTVTLRLRDRTATLPLTRTGEALEASGPPLSGEVIAAFALTRDGAPVEANFMLPVGDGSGAAHAGAAGVPLDGCVAPPATTGNAPTPRCTLSFARPVAALAAVPGGGLLTVAVVDQGMSAWRLPAGSFAFGFAAPPAVVLTAPEPPHPEAPNAIAPRPGGGEIAVALENRVVIYDAASGALRRSFTGPGGIIRAAAWSADGATLLVTTFYRAAAVRLDAADGRVVRQYPLAHEGAAVAVGGGMAAVGDESGDVAVFALDAEQPARVLAAGRGPVRALAFAASTLLAGGDDGVLRAWDTASGAPRFSTPVGGLIQQLAVSPDGKRVASAGSGGGIAVVDAGDGHRLASLPTPAQVLGLAWSGATLAAGDVDGRVALWTP